MSVDLAKISVSLDASGMASGAEQANRALTSVATAEDRRATAADRSNAAVARGVVASQKMTAFLNQQRVAQQAVADAELRAAGGRDAYFAKLEREVTAQNQATAALFKKADAERAATEAWVRNTAAAEASAIANTAAATSTAAVGAKAAVSVSGIRTLTTAFSTMALSAAGASTGLGSVASGVGLLTVGSQAMLGAVAGVAAFVLAFQAVTEKARKARQEAAELTKELRRSAEAFREQSQPLDALKDKLEKHLIPQYRELQRQLAAAQRPTIISDARTGLPVHTIAPDQSAIDTLMTRLSAKADNMNEAYRETAKQIKENAEEEKQQTKARLEQLTAIRHAELDNASKSAELSGSISALEQANLAKARAALKEQIDGLDKLNAAEKENLRIEGERGIILDQMLRRLESIKNLAPKLAVDSTTRAPGINLGTLIGGTAGTGDFVKNLERSAEQIAAAQAGRDIARLEAEGQLKAAVEARRQEEERALQVQLQQEVTLGTKTEAQAEILLNAKKETNEYERQKALLAEQAALRQKNQALAGQALGIAGGSSSSTVQGISAIGGGFLSGGPLGAFAGFTSFVDGLFESAKRAREAARQLAEAGKEFDRSLKSYVDAAYRRGTELSAALEADAARQRELTEQAKQLAKARVEAAGARDWKGVSEALDQFRESMDKLRDAAARNAVQIAVDAAVSARQNRGGIEARIRDLSGDATGAAAIRRQLADEEELRAAQALVNQGVITTRMFNELQQALQDNAAAADAAAEAEKRRRDAQIDSDLRLRTASAQARFSGTPEDQAAYEQARRIADQRREIDDAVAAGWSEAQIEALRTVQAFEELADATAKMRDEAKAAAEQVARNAEIATDLRLRNLAADAGISGNPKDQAVYETARRQAEQEREIRDAMAAGWSEAQIQALKATQANEDFANSMIALRDSLKAAEEAAKAEAYATDDLTVRHLRAIGLQVEADTKAREIANAREVAEATAAGRSQDFITRLIQIQQEEIAKAAQDVALAAQPRQEAVRTPAVRAAPGSSGAYGHVTNYVNVNLHVTGAELENPRALVERIGFEMNHYLGKRLSFEARARGINI